MFISDVGEDVRRRSTSSPTAADVVSYGWRYEGSLPFN
jgi:hypothetical protein